MKYFTEDEKEFVLSNYKTMTYAEIAIELGRSKKSIQAFALRFGLSKQNYWTPDEDAYLLKVAGKIEQKEAAKHLGRTPLAIAYRWREISDKSWASANGFRPDAKGRPIIGFTRKNGQSKAVMEHRFVMEQHLGRELSSEEIVHHIDCDKTNNDINNLHLYSNRSEHASAHHSLNNIIADLLKLGVVCFNRETGGYELCE